MRLTQHTDYAIRLLVYLGAMPGNTTTIEAVATAFDISRNHLTKVVQHLVKAGYVESTRGKGGGIRLALAPREILLGDLVDAMEPDAGLVECLRPGNACRITGVCALPPALVRAQAAFTDELNNLSLQDLLAPDTRESIKLMVLA